MPAELIDDDWEGVTVVILRNEEPPTPRPISPSPSELPDPPSPSSPSLMSSKLPLSSKEPARCEDRNPPREGVAGDSEVEVILSAPGDLVRSRDRVIFVGVRVPAPLLLEEDPVEKPAEWELIREVEGGDSMGGEVTGFTILLPLKTKKRVSIHSRG